MPLGFLIFGIVTIYSLIFFNHALTKICVSIFTVLSMLAYFISPLNIGNLSINLICVASALCCFIVAYTKLNKTQMYNVILSSIMVCVIYIAICNFTTNYLTSLNAILVISMIVILGLVNLKNTNFILCLNALTFLLISLCNLFLESGLGYINFASLDLYNLFVVTSFSLLLLNVLFTYLLSRKRKTV